MRSYGIENFQIELIEEFNTKQLCIKAEIELISSLEKSYNIASGGEGGFNVVDIDDWKSKLRTARKGRQPFLDKKHSDETKEICRQAALKYHASKRAETNDLS
jgi:hypothetical protein